MMITPKAAKLLKVMSEDTRRPSNWETKGLWLHHAQQIAQFLAEHGKNVPISDQIMFIELGGLLVEMAKREREAKTKTKRGPA